jgi:hypothetical protein
VLVFHQGFIEILHLAGALPNQPFSFKPTAPLQVPQVLSLAFWGGCGASLSSFAWRRYIAQNGYGPLSCSAACFRR